MNIDQKEMLQQLDGLLAEYDELCKRSQYEDLSDLPSENRILAYRFQAALDRLTVPESSYGRAANELRRDPSHIKVVELSGIATALREDLKRGWTQLFTELVHADTFGDLLDIASELQDKGYKDAAAVIAGTALEVHLRSLAGKHGLSVQDGSGKYKKAGTLNEEMTKAAVYTSLQQKEVTFWLGIRNEAAHGNHSVYDKNEVQRLLDGVRQFIDSYSA